MTSQAEKVVERFTKAADDSDRPDSEDSDEGANTEAGLESASVEIPDLKAELRNFETAIRAGKARKALLSMANMARSFSRITGEFDAQDASKYLAGAAQKITAAGRAMKP